ncbi:MAG: substrate-binding domain-containing protein, partial [Eubacteriales bacterium]|nr:substrate-binding domain-containing protein [Eubacteriales bacterium]
IVDKHKYRPSVHTQKNKELNIAILKYRVHGMAIEENQGFITSILDQIEYECQKLSYKTISQNCNAAHMASCIEEINRSEIDGVIAIGTELAQKDRNCFFKFRPPVIVVDNSMVNYPFDSITMDNISIMREAVLHLYALGHRQIGYLKSNRSLSNLDERYEGYCKIMEELGLPVAQPILLTPTLNGAYKDMTSYIKDERHLKQSSVLADNDSIAIGAQKALIEAGFKLPEELSIVGVDDIPFSAVTTPSLTTMRISRSAMGALAVDLLRNRIEHPNWPAMRLKVNGSLVVRNSTCQYK